MLYNFNEKDVEDEKSIKESFSMISKKNFSDEKSIKESSKNDIDTKSLIMTLIKAAYLSDDVT